jgi:SAM-dependent methyltransferase
MGENARVSEIELHRKLLGDAARNDAFFAALKSLIEPGKTRVVDIGAGTGFLGFLARRLGARHVTLIEYADTLELARELARANRIDELTFIQAHSGDVRKPPKAELVVSETLGNYALEEGLLETLVDARRFLAPKGRLLPTALKQYVAPVTSPRLQREIDVWTGVGFDLDLAAARRVGLNNMYVKDVTPADLGGALRTARLWDDLDFAPEKPAPKSARSATLKWDADEVSTVHGFALWWDVLLVPGISLSTSPFAPPTHWQQIYLPLLEPLELGTGDCVELTLRSDTRAEVGVRVTWKVRHKHLSRMLEEQLLDSFAGRI